jgi:IS30 family transposase
MNQLSSEKREQIVSALVEGCSIRSIVRMTGASKNTIAKLLVELGAACSDWL